MIRCIRGAGVACIVLFLASPAAAPAATVAVRDGTLTYTAGAGLVNDVTFEQPAAGTVRVVRRSPMSGGQDEDPLAPGEGCEADSTTAADDVRCEGVARIVAEARDADDGLTAAPVGPTATTLDASLDGGAGDDFITGGRGADTLIGGAGDDAMSGAAGADRLDGGGGADGLAGHFGPDRSDDDGAADVLEGGDGADVLDGSDGPDTIAGGGGFDMVDYYRFRAGRVDRDPVTVTLDETADDGEAGEGDLVRPDVEDVAGGSGPDTIRAIADGPNTILSGTGDDTVDPGASEDRVETFDGNDTVTARDGYADRIGCGDGDDSVTADTLDVVAASCERVERADVGSARDVPEDRAPSVTFTAPASDAQLVPAAAPVLSADASDDRGIARVEFLDDGSVIAVDDTAPYTVPYLPTGADVGRNTLAVRAVDSAGQTATDLRAIRLARFAPQRLTLRVRPRRDRQAPFGFRATGRVVPPATVTPVQGCRRGAVSLRILAGRRTVTRRRAPLRPDCSFALRLRAKGAAARRVRVTARFNGTAVLSPSATVARKLRIG